jgi:hypothetical protein
MIETATNFAFRMTKGPGGSGSEWIADAGQELSTIVEGRYDIIGFDPRYVWFHRDIGDFC